MPHLQLELVVLKQPCQRLRGALAHAGARRRVLRRIQQRGAPAQPGERAPATCTTHH